MSHATLENALVEICAQLPAEQRKQLQGFEDAYSKSLDDLAAVHERGLAQAVTDAERGEFPDLAAKLKAVAAAKKLRDEGAIRRGHFQQAANDALRNLAAPAPGILEKLLARIRETIAEPPAMEQPAPLRFWQVPLDLHSALVAALFQAAAGIEWEQAHLNDQGREWAGRWLLCLGRAIEPKTRWDRPE